MSDLAAFQDAFAEALLAPDPAGRLARQPGFAVYRNTCALGTLDALRAAYPTIEALLGEEAFAAAALDFRAEQPPESPVLARYGAAFPGFLARQPWTSELPYLADVARLDRLRLECHLAGDAVPPSRRRWMPAERFHLRLKRPTRFAWFDTPAFTIWKAHQASAEFDTLEPEWRPEGALFTRRDGAVRAVLLDRAEERLLLALAAGLTPADAAAALAVAHPDADFPTLVARLLAAGAIEPA